MKAVALLSGGLDSLVAAHLAAQGGQLVCALTIHYGQRAAESEIRAAAAQAEWLNTAHETVHLRWLADLSETALTDSTADLPTPDEDDLDDPEASERSARAVWVPNRNGLFLNVAAAWAESSGCDRIVAGFNAEEAATFPDNSAAFVEATNKALQDSTRNQVRVISPTLQMTKTEMVHTAVADELPIQTLHSCYRAGPGHCWECESCMRLKRALRQAGQWDRFRSVLSR